MCGISGFYAFKEEEVKGLENVTFKQFSRGPDEGHTFYLKNIGLGHRRLKIFDLSEKAAQPMIDESLGLALVFNGAIYNFPELKKELQDKGYVFTSRSDTEVILKGYHAWGSDFIPRLEGMFAFAIWEFESGKMILARDRLGIKPLYYSVSSTSLKFASTLPAILEFRGISTQINHDALYYYFMFHMVPEPHTLISDVKKLRPGSIMEIYPDGKIKEHSYWKLRFNSSSAQTSLNEAGWVEAAEQSLFKATQRQLMADVPVGILLSGGLDSSLIVALSAQSQRNNLKTFSIGFESSAKEQGDEFFYSDIIAAHFKTDHYKISISNQQITESLEKCVSSMSEPMLSHDNIGFYLLSQEVAKHVKVVLSGQGADELFGGYHWFQGFPSYAASPEHSAHLILNKIADRSYAEYQSIINFEYHAADLALACLTTLCKENASSLPVDNLLLYESTMALANGPLCRVDNMTMSAGLEARVPFLDDKVIDIASILPLNYKLQDNGKYILKKIGEKWLPRAVVHRSKGYFPVPALTHLEGPVLTLIRDVLNSQKSRERGIVNPEYIQMLLNEPNKHLTPAGASKLWQIGLLEYWLQQLNV